MENLNTTPLPRIGDKAPSFEAVTTQGPIRFPEDYAGRWIILFSHPSDFTPVCTSEFMTFAARSDEFEALNCQLVGLSVDGLYSHIAWLRTIRDKIVYRGMQHVEVRFPLIADLRMKVANLYGMIQPGESSTSAVRAVFFIDPDATIRAVIYYPLALGRNFDENQTRARRPANRRPLQRGAARRLASGRRSDRTHRLVVGRCRRAHDPSRRRDAVLRLVLLHAAAAAGRARRSSRTITAKQPQSWQSRN